MTVPSFFTADRSSPSIVIRPSGGTQPTLRAHSGIVLTPNTSTFLPWPSGTIAGDFAVIAVLNGYGPNTPSGWTNLYNTNNQTGVDGGAFCKLLDSADITAGGVTVTYTSNDTYARGAIAIYEDGADINAFLYGVTRNTGTTATHVYPLAALANHSYFVWGAQWGNGAVTFAQATNVANDTGANGSAALGLYEPASNASVTETVSFASASQTLSIIVALTKGGTPGLAVVSNAISAASEGTRWAVGPLYFEMTVNALSGLVDIGLCNPESGFGASTIGDTLTSLGYRNTGIVRLNNATIATIANFVQGDTVRVAYHSGAGLIWFAVNGGSWNNNGLANPETFTGGIDVSTFRGSAAFPACGFSVGGASVSAVFADADFAYTVPTGFYSVEEVVVTVGNTQIQGIADLLVGDQPTDWFGQTVLPEDNHSRAVSFPAGPVKLIAGEVQEEGVGVEGRLVRMYNRRTGEFVGEARTNATGDFIIPAQDPNLPHFVVAFDDDVSPDYNAKVYDNVLPG